MQETFGLRLRRLDSIVVNCEGVIFSMLGLKRVSNHPTHLLSY